jgi:hypothetical protein
MSGEEKKEKGKVEEAAEKTGEIVGGGFSSLWSLPHFCSPASRSGFHRA